MAVNKALVYDTMAWRQRIREANHAARVAQAEQTAAQDAYIQQVAKLVECKPVDLTLSNVLCIASDVAYHIYRKKTCVFCGCHSDDPF